MPVLHMLHIHNGDVTSDTAKQAAIPGEHFAFRESLITGPTPADLTDSNWVQTRARHLAEAYGASEDECARQLISQEEKLASFSAYDEVVLWFEYDLFCQLHLLYLLNWFAQRQLGKTRLSLICIGEFPGKENFRGLGELNASELASLFPKRQQVTIAQVNLAISAWQAYCSANPTDIETLLQTDTTPLPFLSAALAAHLRRFPSIGNGLGRIEARGLEILHSGSTRFVDLFSRFVDIEPVYGLGDLQFWLTLRRMSEGRHPLLVLEDAGNGEAINPALFRAAMFRVTDDGKAVQSGQADFLELNGIDLWLGGTHLSGDSNAWRWNESAQVLSLT